MKKVARLLVSAIVLVSAVALGGCTEGVLAPKGPIAAAERQILFNALGIMLAIVIPTILATLGVAAWFRASNKRARYLPDFEYSGRLEVLVWAIPAMTVLLVGGVAWVGSHDLDPRKPIASAAEPVHVQVVSLGHEALLAAVRLCGAAVVVPMMEELFWRSFLLRFVITLFPEEKTNVTPEFTSIPLGTFTPISFVVTVVLFASEHTLWLAGMMAGAIYTLLLYKTHRLWPCVLAHGVTNLLLGVHVLVTQEWQWW